MVTKQSKPLAPGDRVPDFLLPNVEGTFGRFYDRFAGNAVLLVVLQQSAEELLTADLKALQSARAALSRADVRIVAITLASPAVNARIADALAIDFTLFADTAGQIMEGLGAKDHNTSFLIDSNQRVLVCFTEPAESLASSASVWLARDLPPRQTQIVTAQAPVLLLPAVLDRDTCRVLIETWRSDHAEGAVRRRPGVKPGETKAVDANLKKRLDHRLDGPLNHQISRQVMQRIGPEIVKAFQFRPHVLEKFCIGAYDAGRGDYFRAHRDNSTPQTKDRRFAVTINLNEDYEGGGLKFPEFGDQTYRTEAGGAVVFSCSLLHEALPVTEGRRFAALTFIYGKDALDRTPKDHHQP